MDKYQSEIGKKWLKKFKESSPEDQYKLHNIMQESFPTKPGRDLDIIEEKDPVKKERKKEYQELLKEYNKRIKERTA